MNKNFENKTILLIFMVHLISYFEAAHFSENSICKNRISKEYT